MINSMTGYGCAEGQDEGITYFVEIRAVNNRFFILDEMLWGSPVFELTMTMTALPGDADCDGDVDLDDFGILKNNFGTGTTWGHGDFDRDGDVDLDDFGVLKNNFGTGGTGEEIPEPACAAVLLLGFAGLARRRKRR